MRWLKNLLGLKTPVEKKMVKLSKLQELGFRAQRNGDLRLAGKYYHEAEMLETEIAEMMEGNNEGR